MYNFLINSVSIEEQCPTIHQAKDVFEKHIDCLKYIWPIIKKGRGTLACSAEIEDSSIIPGEAFKATLNRLKGINGDLTRLWYQYTKNRPTESNNPVSIRLTSNPCIGHHRIARINAEVAHPDIIWISFGGNKFTESRKFLVDCATIASYCVENVHSQPRLADLLPKYELNPKHREKAYYDHERKEEVAPMPIRDVAEAGILLRTGLIDGKDIISYHIATKSAYRFKLTGNNIYHGFQIDESEIPPHIRKMLLK